jgi:uncharacterized protein (DUF2345 family)
MPPEEPTCRELGLASGRSVVCRSATGSHDEITIKGSEGEILLEVLLTPAGPVLRFRAAKVQLDCAGDLHVRCKKFDVQASEVTLEAGRGNVDVRANDDVNLNGERVRLNC